MTSPMAQNRDVNVTVNANVDPFTKGINAANVAVVKLSDGLKKLDDRITSIAKKAGASTAAAGAGGLLGLLGSAREAAQLEKAFSALGAQTVRSGESMDRLVSSAKGLSREIPISTAAVAGLMTQVKSLGIEGVNNITRLTKVSAELAAATNTAPGQLFTGLAELTRSFGNSIQNIERYGSSLTALSQRMGVSAEGVLGFANQIQAVGAKAGVAESQILGISAAFQRVGADGFAGANAFNTVVNDISDAIATNSSRLNTYANLLGMTRDQFAELGRTNPSEAFVRFVEAIQKQGTRATQVLQQFGLDGVRTQRVFAALTSGQADLRGALGQSSKAYEENHATADAAAAAWSGAADSFEKAKNAAKNLAASIGGPVADALKPIITAVTFVINKIDDLIQWLNNLPGPFHDLGTKAIAVGSGLLMVGGALTALSWTAIKFLAVWRMVSGTLGINAWRGLADGIKGTSRELENVSAAGGLLYRGGSGVGGALRGAVRRGEPADGEERSRSLFGRIARFPITRARQMGTEMMDTLRHPFTPEARSASATDPYSTYGMFQAGQRGAQRMWGGVSASPAFDRLRGVAGRATDLGSSAYTAGVGWGSAGMRAMQDRLHLRRMESYETGPVPAAPAPGERESRTQGGRFSSAVNTFTRGMHTAGEAAVSGARTVGTGFAKLASGIGGFMSGPWGILATIAVPFVIDAFSKLANSTVQASDKLAYTGAEMAERLGRTFATPTEQAAADRKKNAADQDPFGISEQKDARTGAFQGAYQNTLNQISSMQGIQAQMSRIQLEVNRAVGQNSGAPLDQAQSAEIRELMVNAFGLTQAKSLYGQLDLTGQTGSNFYQQGVGSYLNRYGQSGTAAARQALSTNVVGDVATQGYGNLAYVLGATQNNDIAGNLAAQTEYQLTGGISGSGTGDVYAGVGTKATHDLIGQIVSDYNAQNPKNQLQGNFDVNDIGSFLVQLRHGNSAAQRFADNLEAMGLKVDSSGKLTGDAMTALATAASGAATALTGGGMGGRLDTNSLNQIYRQVTGDQSGYITSALSNTDSINYQQTMNKLLEGAGYSPDELKGAQQGTSRISSLFDDDAEAHVRNRIKQITDLKKVIGDPNDPTYQALDKLLGSAYQQFGQVTSGTNYSPAQTLTAQASVLSDLNVYDPLNADQYQQQSQALTQSVNSSLQTLHGYYMQIRDIHRQLQYGEEDHNRQINHMQRDFNIQQEEAYYQRNEQLRQADYSFAEQQRQAAYSYSESIRQMRDSYNEAFGNPAQFVQSQYTQGASSAMIGMQRQVEYLKRSLSGLSAARGMGVSTDVIRLLGLDKPEAFQQLEKYLVDWANNPQLVQQFNQTISDRLNIQQAMATDPSNSQLVELNRQFQHSADEAQRAFDHAAEESLRAFDHTMEMSNQSFDRGMQDYEESYKISTTRTMDEVARIGESVALTTQDMLNWAAQSGIKGITDLGAAVGAAIDIMRGKSKDALTASSTSGGFFSDLINHMMNTAQSQAAGAAQKSGGTPTSIGGTSGRLGNALGFGTGGLGTAVGGALGTDTFKTAEGAAAKYADQIAALTDSLNVASGTKGGKGVKGLVDAITRIPKRTDITIVLGTKAVDAALDGMQQSIQSAVAIAATTLNVGLLGAWNYIVTAMGLPFNLRINPFTGFVGAKGGKGFSVGGYTGDGGKDDPAGVVHAGEFVLDQEKTRRHRPLLEAIHRGLPGYADGGPVTGITWPQLDAIRKSVFPGSVLTSSIRKSNDYHGRGEAIDIGVSGNRQDGLMPIAAKLALMFPQSTELIHNPNGSIKNGHVVPPSFWGAATWAQHANHVHWAMTPEALRGVALPSGAAGGDGLIDPIAYMRASVQRTGKAMDAAAMAPLMSAIGPQLIDVVQAANINSLLSNRRKTANGGLFTRATDVTMGESGPEGILPLNGVGAEFMARTIQATLRQMQGARDYRVQRGGLGYASQQTPRTEIHSYDQSANYGDVTVVANDPAEFERKLADRKRAQALTRPMARR